MNARDNVLFQENLPCRRQPQSPCVQTTDRKNWVRISISYIFQLHDNYEIKLHTKISHHTVGIFHAPISGIQCIPMTRLLRPCRGLPWKSTSCKPCLIVVNKAEHFYPFHAMKLGLSNISEILWLLIAEFDQASSLTFPMMLERLTIEQSFISASTIAWLHA